MRCPECGLAGVHYRTCSRASAPVDTTPPTADLEAAVIERAQNVVVAWRTNADDATVDRLTRVAAMHLAEAVDALDIALGVRR